MQVECWRFPRGGVGGDVIGEEEGAARKRAPDQSVAAVEEGEKDAPTEEPRVVG